jgi:hypothetical protein
MSLSITYKQIPLMLMRLSITLEQIRIMYIRLSIIYKRLSKAYCLLSLMQAISNYAGFFFELFSIIGGLKKRRREVSPALNVFTTE